MPVDHERKLVFFHIPRTGGTSIEQALGMLGDFDRLDARRVFGRDEETGEGVQHLPPSHIGRHLAAADLRSYFKFTFVRNPFDRLLSEFFWRLSSSEEQAGKANLPRFLAWVEEILTHDRWQDDLSLLHLWPQSAFVFAADGTRLVDFVGRFEHLQDDFDRLCQQLGLPPATLPRISKTRHGPYQDYFDRRDLELIARLYRADLQHFYPSLLVEGAHPNAGRERPGRERPGREQPGQEPPGRSEERPGIDLEQAYEIGDEVAFSIIDGRAHLQHLATMQRYELNDTGTEIWLGLARRRPPRAILEQLQRRYDGICGETLSAEVALLLSDLLQHRLIAPVLTGA